MCFDLKQSKQSKQLQKKSLIFTEKKTTENNKKESPLPILHTLL